MRATAPGQEDIWRLDCKGEWRELERTRHWQNLEKTLGYFLGLWIQRYREELLEKWLRSITTSYLKSWLVFSSDLITPSLLSLLYAGIYLIFLELQFVFTYPALARCYNPTCHFALCSHSHSQLKTCDSGQCSVRNEAKGRSARILTIAFSELGHFGWRRSYATVGYEKLFRKYPKITLHTRICISIMSIILTLNNCCPFILLACTVFPGP